MNKRLILAFFILVFLFTGSLILFQKPIRLAAMPACPCNLLGTAVDWRAQDYDNSQGITAVQYDETEKCLVLDCDLKGKDPHLSQGEIILDLNYIPCLEANTPVNMTGRLIKVTIQVPAGFVGPSSTPNGCQVFVKDTSYRSQYGTWVNCTHSGTFTVKLKPSKVNPYLGQTTTGFDPTKIRTIGIKLAINANSTFPMKGTVKITRIEVTPALPFTSAPEITGSLPAPFVTANSNVALHTDGFYIDNNKWFIVGGNWRLIDYRQNFGSTAWFPKGNGISHHPGFVGTKLGWFRQAGFTLVRVGLLDDGATLLNRSGKVINYNQAFKKDVTKFLELAALNNMKVEFSLVDFLVAGKEEQNAGVWLKGHREIIENPEIRQEFIQNFLTPFLQEFGNSPVIFGFDIINEPEWIISKDYGGAWEDVTDLKNKAEAPILIEEFKNFVDECAAKIRELAPGKFVTVGVSGTNLELLNNLNTNLDYTAVHYYPSMGNLLTNLAQIPKDKPWILEEFP
ncbi:MAG TPA: cellulase family glycosylhydrolase, partial [Candidatus Kapabacteria bacterium]|nr:cellulase family glycosylhydrolase [Candidatus Kapabacteria bacterium]